MNEVAKTEQNYSAIDGLLLRRVSRMTPNGRRVWAWQSEWQLDAGLCPHCGVPVLPGQRTSCGTADDGLLIGNAAIARMGRDCCGKPQGCTNPTDECLYKDHPFKRHLYRP